MGLHRFRFWGKFRAAKHLRFPPALPGHRPAFMAGFVFLGLKCSVLSRLGSESLISERDGFADSRLARRDASMTSDSCASSSREKGHGARLVRSSPFGAAPLRSPVTVTAPLSVAA
jgi:hypothetical protein